MDIDTLIKSKFKLYQGLRTKAEDDAIYQKVYDLAFDEIMVFVDEQLEVQKKKSLIQALERLAKLPGDEATKAQETMTILLEYLKTIPAYFDLITTRLERLFDQFLHDALKRSII